MIWLLILVILLLPVVVAGIKAKRRVRAMMQQDDLAEAAAGCTIPRAAVQRFVAEGRSILASQPRADARSRRRIGAWVDMYQQLDQMEKVLIAQRGIAPEAMDGLGRRANDAATSLDALIAEVDAVLGALTQAHHIGMPSADPQHVPGTAM